MKTDNGNSAECAHRLCQCLAIVLPLIAGLLGAASGCAESELKPVDLYPEDMCGLCRMAVSDHRCAAEIITAAGEVLKFDDIACMENFRASDTTLVVAAAFVKNYENRAWLPLSRAVVAQTNIVTPMGSGKIAFADSTRARAFLREHSPQGLH